MKSKEKSSVDIINKLKKINKKYLIGSGIALVAIIIALIYGIFKITANTPYTSLLSGGTFDDENSNWYGYITSNDENVNTSFNQNKSDGVFKLDLPNNYESAIFTSNEKMTFVTGKKYRITYSVKLENGGYVLPKISAYDENIGYSEAWNLNGWILNNEAYSNNINLTQLNTNLSNSTYNTSYNDAINNVLEWESNGFIPFYANKESIYVNNLVDQDTSWHTYSYEFIYNGDDNWYGSKNSETGEDGAATKFSGQNVYSLTFEMWEKGDSTPDSTILPGNQQVQFDNISVIELNDESGETPTDQTEEVLKTYSDTTYDAKMLGGTFEEEQGGWYTYPNNESAGISNSTYKYTTSDENTTFGNGNSVKLTTGKKYRISYSVKMNNEGYVVPKISHEDWENNEDIDAWNLNGYVLKTNNIGDTSTDLKTLNSNLRSAEYDSSYNQAITELEGWDTNGKISYYNKANALYESNIVNKTANVWHTYAFEFVYNGDDLGEYWEDLIGSKLDEYSDQDGIWFLKFNVKTSANTEVQFDNVSVIEVKEEQTSDVDNILNSISTDDYNAKMLGGTFEDNIGAWYTNGGEGNIKDNEYYQLTTAGEEVDTTLGSANSIKLKTGKTYRITFSSKLNKEGYVSPVIQQNKDDYMFAWLMNGRLLKTTNLDSNITSLEDINSNLYSLKYDSSYIDEIDEALKWETSSNGFIPYYYNSGADFFRDSIVDKTANEWHTYAYEFVYNGEDVQPQYKTFLDNFSDKDDIFYLHFNVYAPEGTVVDFDNISIIELKNTPNPDSPFAEDDESEYMLSGGTFNNSNAYWTSWGTKDGSGKENGVFKVIKGETVNDWESAFMSDESMAFENEKSYRVTYSVKMNQDGKVIPYISSDNKDAWHSNGYLLENPEYSNYDKLSTLNDNLISRNQDENSKSSIYSFNNDYESNGLIPWWDYGNYYKSNTITKDTWHTYSYEFKYNDGVSDSNVSNYLTEQSGKKVFKLLFNFGGDLVPEGTIIEFDNIAITEVENPIHYDTPSDEDSISSKNTDIITLNNGVITVKLPKGTKLLTKKYLLDNLTVSSNSISVKYGDNEIDNDENLIPSGSILKLSNSEYPIILLGDVQSDGRINIRDVSKLYNSLDSSKETGSTLNEKDLLSAFYISGTRVNIRTVSALYGKVQEED